MDQPADVTAISGEHIILECDTVEIETLNLELEEEVPPTDPYDTSQVKVLRPGLRCLT